ncbi:biotin carboxylase N-terminal domain-containing protein [Trueperella pyogenes]|uniref:biotin carboxylase N-terminal domain-containing protein n=1 Tax=Trueperella pyogenes TaxID=1661 RepID=UPI003DA8CB62
MKILIANRSEIALRIIRTANDLGIETVVGYADDDYDAPFTHLAGQAYALGGSSYAETYMDGAKLVELAKRTGAHAVHPGYGFLSENAEFAQAVQEAGLTWIGPAPTSAARARQQN